MVVKPVTNIGGNVAEIEGLPQSPDTNEYYDENTGECNITFGKCDCSEKYVSQGCSMCNRAHEKYVAKMVKLGVIKPSEKVEARAPYVGAKAYMFYKNKLNTVFLHTDDELTWAKDSWWFKHLKEIPNTLWNVTVEKFEYPSAFALYEAIGRKRPDRVLVGKDLPMIFQYPNMYYIIAPCSQLTPEEIREDYKKIEDDAEARARTEEQLQLSHKARQAGNGRRDAQNERIEEAAAELHTLIENIANKSGMSPVDVSKIVVEILSKPIEPDSPTRPVNPTRDKRETYGSRRRLDRPTNRPTERRVYTQPPATAEPVRDEPKIYHTTRGTKVRK